MILFVKVDDLYIQRRESGTLYNLHNNDSRIGQIRLKYQSKQWFTQKVSPSVINMIQSTDTEMHLLAAALIEKQNNPKDDRNKGPNRRRRRK
jgi:hypothetical protein